MAITIKTAATPKEIQQAHAIRHKVFVLEQGIPSDLNLDGRDDDAAHVLVYLDGFYANLGYEKSAETMQVAGYRLFKMRKKLL